MQRIWIDAPFIFISSYNETSLLLDCERQLDCSLQSERTTFNQTQSNLLIGSAGISSTNIQVTRIFEAPLQQPDLRAVLSRSLRGGMQNAVFHISSDIWAWFKHTESLHNDLHNYVGSTCYFNQYLYEITGVLISP